uniref:Transposase Tnp1/En/Spm-like domain-containing protein n=1 Tax=Setaria viridis TaxID=4556 RepID=A0A4U6T6N8_SETVI|nr:hypothetical protein SEVIR_9G456032v2 [Setaria viridis]
MLTNMRTRRVKGPSLNWSESSCYPVYLLSLRNKGRIVAKAKLVTTDGKRETGGRMLGKEYVGVNVEGLENVENAIGYSIPWPRSHGEVKLRWREGQERAMKRRCC